MIKLWLNDRNLLHDAAEVSEITNSNIKGKRNQHSLKLVSGQFDLKLIIANYRGRKFGLYTRDLEMVLEDGK